MNARRTTIFFAAACLFAAPAPIKAETDTRPASDTSGAGPSPSSPHHPVKTRSKRTATHQPAIAKSASPDTAHSLAAERAESLERRRKAFFANKPDESEPAGDGASAPVGVTLGGSGGLQPEMGLKF